jgi:GNAT superfamily N-acetyltransferase
MSANDPWRPMRPQDIPAVFALSRRVHLDHPEREAVLAEKRGLFPAGCFVLDVGEQVAGYCFSHPWHDAPPNLDTFVIALPATPSRYFIHDVTLDESARGKGHAAALMPVLARVARTCGVPQMMLVAVNGAEEFWSRFGFTEMLKLQATVREKYGPRAVAMERTP